jgi:hypothetical protein
LAPSGLCGRLLLSGAALFVIDVDAHCLIYFVTLNVFNGDGFPVTAADTHVVVTNIERVLQKIIDYYSLYSQHPESAIIKPDQFVRFLAAKPFCFFHLKTKQIVWFSNGKNKMATKLFETGHLKTGQFDN